MRRQKFTYEEMQRAIGRGYRAGHRDGASDYAYVNGSWLGSTAREEAEIAVEEMRERLEKQEARDMLSAQVRSAADRLASEPLDVVVREIIDLIQTN